MDSERHSIASGIELSKQNSSIQPPTRKTVTFSAEPGVRKGARKITTVQKKEDFYEHMRQFKI